MSYFCVGEKAANLWRQNFYKILEILLIKREIIEHADYLSIEI